MERLPQNENVEQAEVWRELRQQAPEQARHAIDAIEGYEDMNESQQIETLKTLLQELASDNDNRFVVEVIAHRITFMEELQQHEKRLTELGIAA